MELDLSMVSDDDFQCYNTSEEKPVHNNPGDELQLLPNETNPTPETGTKTKETTNERTSISEKIKENTPC